MEVIFEIKKENLSKAKDVLLKDDVVSRASVLFKQASTFGIDKNVYFVYISGLEEACERSAELIKDFGKKVDDKVKEQIIQKIKEEENSAATGFGTIFG